MGKNYRNFSKSSKNPRRPFESERLDQELLLIGKYGLKNKQEVWRVQYLLARIRKAARELLTLGENHPRRLFEGEALINRMVRIGVLSEETKKLDYVLGLTLNAFFDRRLQTIVFTSKNANSIHEARSVIFQRKIAVTKGLRRQIVNVPSYIVRKENESLIAKLSSENEQSRTRKRTARKNEEKKNKGDAEEEA